MIHNRITFLISDVYHSINSILLSYAFTSNEGVCPLATQADVRIAVSIDHIVTVSAKDTVISTEPVDCVVAGTPQDQIVSRCASHCPGSSDDVRKIKPVTGWWFDAVGRDRGGTRPHGCIGYPDACRKRSEHTDQD